MDDFDVHARVSGTRALITITGELDASTAPVLRARLQAVIAAGARSVVIDLRRVVFIESVVLGVMIAARKKLGGPDKRVCVVLDPGQTSIRKVFAVTGLDEVFPVHPTPEAAEEDCADDPPAA